MKKFDEWKCEIINLEVKISFAVASSDQTVARSGSITDPDRQASIWMFDGSSG